MVPLCLQAGELNCDETACCDGSMCITDGTDIACAALCANGDDCFSGCCATVDEANSVCAPADVCSPPAETPSVGCGEVVLMADDGTYLGDATSNEFAGDGVCNEFSQYGSQFSSTSIFNEFSEYGNRFNSSSAYNEFTTTPPVLYCAGDGTVLNPVSKNTFLAGAIDPDFLCEVLAQNGL